MSLSCRVTEDLLPLYRDRVCSAESAALVEEHLASCGECKWLLETLNGEAERPASSVNDAAPLKAIRKIWDKSRKRAFIRGAAIALAVCAVLAGAYFGLTQWRCIPVPADLLEVSEASQLADGRIIYRMNINDNKTLRFIKFTRNDDGSYYITPMRAVIEARRRSAAGMFDSYDIVDIDRLNEEGLAAGEAELTALYLGPEDGAALIWEKGEALPPASAELELFASARG